MVGGFDLIYKGKDVTLPEASIYTSMLGCRVNRLENMRKLARSCAYRLSKEFLEAEAARLKQETKKKEEVVNKFNLKTTKPRSNLYNPPASSNPPSSNNPKKKSEASSEFNRYISEREERKSTTNNTPQQQPRQQEEEE